MRDEAVHASLPCTPTPPHVRQGYRRASCGVILTILVAVPIAAWGQTPEGVAKATERPPCAEGVIKDDGSVDTGYGFVPSATEGTYVQAFSSGEFEHPFLDRVCVCWLKTRYDRDVEFEVQLYADVNGRPAASPLARVKASAKDVARSVADAGAFVDVDMHGVAIPEGPFFIGVQWNPSVAKFLFVCVDRGEATAKIPTFYREGAVGWTSVEESRDPIFVPHRALMLRAISSEKKGAPPILPKADASAPPVLKPDR